MSNLTPLTLIELRHVPIYDQLILEEQLLRTGSDNFCIVNYGAPKAMVLGISNKTEQHIDIERLPQELPVVRRYSGGGSVVVDENTLFVSFIFNKKDLIEPVCPASLMRWSAHVFKEAFDKTGLELKEHDLVIGEKKCVGNAQYFQKERVCHHATLLYDYHSARMNYLAYPPKTPDYRKNRAHDEFLCRFKPYFKSVADMSDQLVAYLDKHYLVSRKKVENLNLKKNCRIATKLLNMSEENLQKITV